MDDDDPDQYDSGLERTASALDDETEGDVEDEEGVDEGMVGEDEEGEEDVDVEDEDEDEDELMRDRGTPLGFFPTYRPYYIHSIIRSPSYIHLF